MTSSAPRQLPEIPQEIILHVIAHLAPLYGSWDDLRGYLHLRLVSSWFGSSFEKVAFEAIRLDLHSSPSSTSNQFVKMLQRSSVLAGYVRYLAVSDEEAYQELMISNLGVQPGTPAFGAFARQVTEEAGIQHEQIVALTQACSSIESLAIYIENPRPQALAKSLFWDGMKGLDSVLLHGSAVSKHLGDFLRARLSDISLMISPLRFTQQYTPQDFMSALAPEDAISPLDLRLLDIADANVDFAMLFLARVPVRPRSLCLRFQSYDRLAELVESLAMGSLLGTTQDITFSYVSKSSPVIDRPPDFTEQVRRLQVTGPAGLRVMWEP